MAIFSKQFSLCLVIFAMALTMANAGGLMPVDINLPWGGYYNNKLSTEYYKDSCPGLLEISKTITEEFVKNDPRFAPGLLRMIFHDCIVMGCDASLLLDPTPWNNQTEKDAVPNSTLRGFEVINAIKAELEKQCPDTVSCADVLALASRDAVVAINGPDWVVPLGRKDGKISLASEALAKIPSPFSNITTLKKNFADVGLTPKELAILSGSHTIGRGHCFVIRNRLYNFTGNGDTDPAIEKSYADYLKTQCPPDANDSQSSVGMDFFTPGKFDEVYYGMVTHHKGLFQSDAALLNDPETSFYVHFQAYSGRSTFAEDFGWAMMKLIQIGVLTDNEGEVRKTCGAVRYY